MAQESYRGQNSTELESARTFTVEASTEMQAKEVVREEHGLGDNQIAQVVEHRQDKMLVVVVSYDDMAEYLDD